jgi:hypothetical protein
MIPIRTVCTSALLLGVTFCCRLPAQEAAALRVIRWDELREQDKLSAGQVVETDGPHAGVLKIDHPGPGPASFELVEITDPGITELAYAVTGQVRYDDVSGTGYLEMWNYFPDGEFFSRTLAGSGPLGSISGTSAWRDFQLPFMLGDDPSTARPNRLVVNLHLAGPGTVYLGGLQLAHISPAVVGMPAGAWWGDRAAGLVGGIAGSILGLIGAAVGVLTGLGRGRRIVTLLMYAIIAGGGVALVLGIVALVMRQPYAVYYPLLLLGILSTVLGATLLPTIKKRFDEAELRRMQALDVA